MFAEQAPPSTAELELMPAREMSETSGDPAPAMSYVSSKASDIPFSLPSRVRITNPENKSLVVWDKWKVKWDGSPGASRERSQWEAIVDDHHGGQRFYKLKSSTGNYLVAYRWHWDSCRVACSETAHFKDATSWTVIPTSGKGDTFYLQPWVEGFFFLLGTDAPGDEYSETTHFLEENTHMKARASRMINALPVSASFQFSTPELRAS
ncbi:hypothetical protein FB451DRAFT_1188237 [Mycena latifolia]|nr:hypothetical protein FB451DRAFT_1188237 [Mycena latifolia]